MTGGVALFDYDGDEDVDIYFLNGAPLRGTTAPVPPRNALYRNEGNWKFTDVTSEAGVGDTGFGLGVAIGDYDNDGHSDIYVNNYGPNVLYRNKGDGTFTDVTKHAGVANGNAMGAGRFVDVSKECGQGLAVTMRSRGAGFDDLDNDGDIDAVILNARSGPTILRNESQTENHWIQIRLRGHTSNRSGVGAHVKVVAGTLTQLKEVHSGRGYQSHYGMRLHFGLGNRDRIDRIEVRWIGGGSVDVITKVPVDQIVSISEGTAKAEPLTRR
jgi:hypothetical protein